MHGASRGGRRHEVAREDGGYDGGQLLFGEALLGRRCAGFDQGHPCRHRIVLARRNHCSPIPSPKALPFKSSANFSRTPLMVSPARRLSTFIARGLLPFSRTSVPLARMPASPLAHPPVSIRTGSVSPLPEIG